VRFRQLAAAALACALACGERAPASPSELAELYFTRLARREFTRLAPLYAPAFLADVEESGTPWLRQLAALHERRGPLLAFELQTRRTLPALDGERVELTYRVTYEHQRGIEKLTVRPPREDGEPIEIVAHAIDEP